MKSSKLLCILKYMMHYSPSASNWNSYYHIEGYRFYILMLFKNQFLEYNLFINWGFQYSQPQFFMVLKYMTSVYLMVAIYFDSTDG